MIFYAYIFSLNFISSQNGKGGIWGALRMWTPDMSWASHGRRCGLSGIQWSCYLGIACAWKMFTFLYKCWVLWQGQLVFLAFYAWKYLTLSLTYSAHQPLTLPNLCFQQGLDQLTSKFGTLDHIGVAFVKDLRFSLFFSQMVLQLFGKSTTRTEKTTPFLKEPTWARPKTLARNFPAMPRRVLLFMPHCDRPLYEVRVDVLWWAG